MWMAFCMGNEWERDAINLEVFHCIGLHEFLMQWSTIPIGKDERGFFRWGIHNQHS